MTRIIVNRYQIEVEIGSGGMGTVYKGLDILTGSPVAIKHLRAELTSDDFIERFKREGEALRELDHPNIVKLLDMVTENNSHYLILEYVSGGDLSDLIQQGSLTIERILNLSIDLADALTRAHKLQIIHRDLKPANILVTHDDTLRLTDFGIAHVSSKKRVTDASAIMGTIDYLSPEMINGEVIDSRVDIWAFGVLLFEMLTGQHPFKTDSPMATMNRILTAKLPDLETIRQDIPVPLTDLVYRMLERDRHSRIASVRHVGAALEDILYGRQSPTNQTDRFVTPATNKLARPKHNLRTQTTPFVGREHEIEELTQLLSNPQIRLLTVLAPGGMGKTRLSLEVATRQIGIFSHGVFFVELAALSDPTNIPTAIADAVGYQFQLDGRERRQQILDYMANKHMLLLIDNWEHLVEGASLVSDILQAAVDVKILATSRERLNLQEEILFRIRGMDFPDGETTQEDLEHSAVKLFVQSAKRAQPAFKLKSNDVNHVIRICYLVGGMPLGILLAAAWLDMLSLHEIADEISRSLTFLETKARNVPERQRSIRAVFDYSWNLMSDDERDVLMKLSVFRGGFTREAAQHVAGATLRHLASLVNKSLIWRDTDKGRYHIHELLRQYAGEQLEARSGDAIYDLHSEYYTEFIQSHIPMHGGRQVQAVASLESDIENIRSAWQWAMDHGKVDAIQRAAHTLLMFYQFRSSYLEGADVFAKAIQSLDRLEPTVPQQYALTNVLVPMGWFRMRLGQTEESRAAFERSAAILDTLGLAPPRFPAADPRAALSLVWIVLGDYAKAVAIAEDTYRACVARGDKGNLITCSLGLASALLAQGNYQAAKQAAQEGCDICLELAHDWLLAYCLNQLGSATQGLGDYQGAWQHFQASYTLREELNDAEGMGVALNHLGKLAWAQGDYIEAKQLYQRSFALYQNIGDRGGLVGALFGLGMAACKLDDDRTARQHFHSALKTALEARLMPLAMSIIVSVIELFPETTRQAIGIELLVLALDHPASDYATKEKAQRILTEYQITSERLPQIRQHLDFNKATSALLLELQTFEEKPSVTTLTSTAEQFSLLDPLTEREIEILHLIADGLSNHEIASKMFISIGTVKWFCSHIYDKLGVKSRTQALVRARQLNLLS